MQLYRLLLILLLSLSLTSVGFAGKIKRSCFGGYKVTTQSLPVTQTLVIGNFKGVGSCGGLNPNRCRNRAVVNLVDCMGKHWLTRARDHRPIQCTPDEGVFHYPFVRLKAELEGEICERLRIDNEEIVVSIYTKITGGSRCNISPLLAGNYRINCSQY